MTNDERKKLFVKELAKFLAGDQARKSIELQMGRPAAKEWASLRGMTPLMGYPSVEDAEIVLTEFLR